MTASALMAISDRQSAAPVTWADNSLHVGSVNHLGYSDIHSHWWPDPPYRPWVQPFVTTTTVHVRPNATETAFKIVSRMIADGIVEDLTVKKFVKLVDDVAKIVRES
jgi:hypothetical protein